MNKRQRRNLMINLGKLPPTQLYCVICVPIAGCVGIGVLMGKVLIPYLLSFFPEGWWGKYWGVTTVVPMASACILYGCYLIWDRWGNWTA